MTTNNFIPRSGAILRRSFALLAGLALLNASASAHPTTPRDRKPAASEFGLGPRQSEHGLYTATLRPAQALRSRHLARFPMVLRDADDQPVGGATISVDGGMPEHGHGLPTRPRITCSSEEGIYEIEGLRFNMGGGWELAFTIDGPHGPDRIVFHLQL